MSNSSYQKNQNNQEMQGKYLTFFIDKQLFGIPIADVMQIIGMQSITQVPEFPYYAKGLINLRGSVIPVIDVRLRLNKPETDYNERTCIIVVNINENHIGFIVDEVDEVTDIDDKVISKPPVIGNERGGTYLTGVAKMQNKVILLINTSKLVGGEDFDLILESLV